MTKPCNTCQYSFHFLGLESVNRCCKECAKLNYEGYNKQHYWGKHKPMSLELEDKIKELRYKYHEETGNNWCTGKKATYEDKYTEWLERRIAYINYIMSEMKTNGN
jgi:hypothetical protein